MTERLIGVLLTPEEARALLVKTTPTAEEAKHLITAHQRIEKELARLEPDHWDQDILQ